MIETTTWIDYDFDIETVSPEEIMEAGGADAYAALHPEKSLDYFFEFAATNPLSETEIISFDEFLFLIKQLNIDK